MIIWALIGLLVGGIGMFLFLLPKLRYIDYKNQDAADLNYELRLELASLTARKESMLKNIEDLELQAKQAREIFVKQNQELAEAEFERSAEAMAFKFQEATQEYENEYLAAMEEAVYDIVKKIAEYKEELNSLDAQIIEKQAIVNAAVEANKRAAEMANQINFYKINLTDDDLDEITRIKNILPYLRNKEVLNKVVWKVYYEKPTSDLIGRVVGSGTHTGIYKITHIDSQMCYVGQAVNIAERWRQHIKRGLGAEPQTKNKLYPAMSTLGVENFTFEIIEECDRTLLNDREDYWQEYFKAKEFGYSIK